MAVIFSGTFDDSGDHDDPEHNSASFGGYIGPKDAWDLFENKWQLALDAFDVPYLHMREMKNPRGKYAHLLNERLRMADFFSALANVIGECNLTGYGSVVRTADLQKFNAESGMSVDGYSLTLMECLANISLHYPGVSMDLRVDRGQPRPRKKIDVAWDYLATSKSNPECYENAEKYIDLAPIPADVTFRNFRPMQAADFAAWEVRKNVIIKDEFFRSKIAMHSKDRSFLDYWRWLAEKEGSITIPPQTDRKSFRALNQASQIYGSVWDYRALCDEHKARDGIWSL